MPYIDRTFFTSFSDAEISETEFPRFSERASDFIDALTMNKIAQAGGLTAFSEADQTAIKKATAAQVEYAYYNGGLEFFREAGVQSGFTIGKFSVSSGQTQQTPTVDGIAAAPGAISYLRPTGLLYRGIGPAAYGYGVDTIIPVE